MASSALEKFSQLPTACQRCVYRDLFGEDPDGRPLDTLLPRLSARVDMILKEAQARCHKTLMDFLSDLVHCTFMDVVPVTGLVTETDGQPTFEHCSGPLKYRLCSRPFRLVCVSSDSDLRVNGVQNFAVDYEGHYKLTAVEHTWAHTGKTLSFATLSTYSPRILTRHRERYQRPHTLRIKWEKGFAEGEWIGGKQRGVASVLSLGLLQMNLLRIGWPNDVVHIVALYHGFGSIKPMTSMDYEHVVKLDQE